MVRVVHDDVEAAELVDRLLHERVALGAFGDVGDRAGRPSTRGLDRGVGDEHCVGGEIARHHVGALLCELHTDRPAQAGADS